MKKISLIQTCSGIALKIFLILIVALMGISAETLGEIEDSNPAENVSETDTEAEAIPKPPLDVSEYLEIKDEKYKDLTVRIPPAKEATNEEIDEEIKKAILSSEDHEELVKKITEGTVKPGDIVNIDYEGIKDGVAFDGGTSEGYDLEIGSGIFIDGFEEGLIGKEIGSEVDLDLTFPENYGIEDLNGQDVVFHVKLNYVVEIPELTDELAKKLSGDEYDTVDGYVESVRSDIQANHDEEYLNTAYTQIMQKLAELYPLEEYSEESVEYYVNNIMSQYIEPNASMYGMSVEDFIAAAYDGITEEEFREQQLIPAAKTTLDQEIILTAIGKKEGIDMPDPELDKLLQDYADDYGVTVDELIAGMDREAVRSSELQRKVMEWLFENVNIEETQEQSETE